MIELFIGMVFIFGFVIGRASKRYTKSNGLFIINDSSDKVTKWILDVKCDPNDISKMKQIVFDVKIQKEDFQTNDGGL